MKADYRPYRIMQKFEVVGEYTDLKSKYPHARTTKPARNNIGGHAAVFEVGIINNPTNEEVAIFDVMPKMVVRAIPQDNRGFDKRDSGVARSIRTSVQARERTLLDPGKKPAEGVDEKNEQRSNVASRHGKHRSGDSLSDE